jgi:hypothetical protein
VASHPLPLRETCVLDLRSSRPPTTVVSEGEPTANWPIACPVRHPRAITLDVPVPGPEAQLAASGVVSVNSTTPVVPGSGGQRGTYL